MMLGGSGSAGCADDPGGRSPAYQHGFGHAWRTLHLRVDTETGTIVASSLTGKEVDDAAGLDPLLDQMEEPVAAVIADGAITKSERTTPWPSTPSGGVVPPRATAVLNLSAETDPTARSAGAGD